MSSLENRALAGSAWQQVIQAIADRWSGLVHAVQEGIHTISDGIHHWSQMFWVQLASIQHQLGDGLAALTTTIATASLWHIVVYWLLLLVAIAGVIGAFVPALPGIILIVGAVVLWGLIQGFTGLGWALGVALVAFLLGVAIDYLAGIIGAQKVGASRWSQVGAIVGMVLGFLGLIPALPVGGPILGILIGTVLGAAVGEFLHRSNLELWPRVQQSFRVGIAIVVGTLVGNLLQGFLAVIAFVVFLVATWGTVYGG
ncbi:MAG: DUF456 family protein [Cyanobacteria bacterium J06627_8]